MESAEQWKATKLTALLDEFFFSDNIYNADETGLFIEQVLMVL